ncbi:hypothetical protein SDC9_206408 [bioreactor metagenome]|uniref:Radical SAM C-terminal extension domain-containing protein n=1 Tax=bioreactor metagenome TaxID=1076179 RepID=A0A645J5N3_9ZZZZ
MGGKPGEYAGDRQIRRAAYGWNQAPAAPCPEGTALAESYRRGELRTLEPDEYYEMVADALELLSENVVIHRLTGDGAKRDLISPKWSGDKKRVLVDMNRVLRARDIQPARE